MNISSLSHTSKLVDEDYKAASWARDLDVALPCHPTLIVSQASDCSLHRVTDVARVAVTYVAEYARGCFQFPVSIVCHICPVNFYSNWHVSHPGLLTIIILWHHWVRTIFFRCSLRLSDFTTSYFVLWLPSYSSRRDQLLLVPKTKFCVYPLLPEPLLPSVEQYPRLRYEFRKLVATGERSCVSRL